MDEIFVPVDGYEGIYEVSNFGRVKALQRVAPNHLFGTMIMKEKFLKIDTPHKSGYIFVSLSKKKKRKHYAVHRLVAYAFIKNPKKLPEVNHKDCVKTNNTVSNLEWCDRKANHNHAMENGLLVILTGEKHWNTRLTEKKVIEIRKMYITGKYSYADIGKIFGVGKSCISAIIKERSWAHLTN